MVIGSVSAQEDTNTTNDEASATIEESNNIEQTLETQTSVASVNETTNENEEIVSNEDFLNNEEIVYSEEITEQASLKTYSDSNNTQEITDYDNLDYEGDVVLGASITQTPTLTSKSLNGGTFADIQNAINTASAGDSIFLNGKTYTGTGTQITINKNINIYGGSSATDTKMATLNANSKSRIIYINSNDVTKVSLKGLNLENGYLSNNDTGGALYVYSNKLNLTFTDSIVNNNKLDYDATSQANGGCVRIFSQYYSVKNIVFKNNNVECKNSFISGAVMYVRCLSGGIVDNCTFINNNEIAINGAGILQISSQNGVSYVTNCVFINNSMPQHGGAICDYGDKGCYIQNCIFINNTASFAGAIAIHHVGNIKNCTFIGNNVSEYGGAVSMFTEGNGNITIDDCKFYNNSAPKGGAIYVIDNGYNLTTTINDCVFENNTASGNGGGVYIDGNNNKILNSNLISNTASGNGGGLYIKGNNNQLTGAVFEGNVARNGSGIYNVGDNFTIKNSKLLENQAWSYLLNVTAKPSISNYDGAPVNVSIVYIAGDNIANAIYHNGAVNTINFNNVTYMSSRYGLRTTTSSELHPVNGVENSKEGKLLYLDTRVDNQVINLTINNTSTGKITTYNLRSDIYGNVTQVLTKFDPGVYSVSAVHPEDSMYKSISNTTSFTILPIVDVAVSKTSDKSVYVLGENVVYTIVVSNNGKNTAHDVVLKDLLPKNLVFISSNITGYNPVTGVLNIGDLDAESSMSFNIIAKANAMGNITTYANVSCSDDETDYSNNNASNKIEVNINSTKSVDTLNPVKNQIITYKLTVQNIGNTIYSDTITLTDYLSEGLTFVDVDSISGAELVKTTSLDKKVIFEIKNIKASDVAVITVKVLVNSDGTWSNDLELFDRNSTVNITTVDSKKEVNNKNPVVGETIQYNLTITNTGDVKITNGVGLIDSLPDGLEYAGKYSIVGGNVLKFTQNGNKLVWSVTNITTNSPMVITVGVNVTKDGTWTNNLTLNNFYTVNETVITVVPNKTVNNLNPVVGEIIYYNLTILNTGSITINNTLNLVDNLPEGLEYAGKYSVIGGDVIKFTQNGNKLFGMLLILQLILRWLLLLV